MQDFGFIFDLDGTLLNSTDIGKNIQDKIMEKFNIVLTPERKEELEELAESMLDEDYSTWLAIKIIWTLLKEVGLSFKQRLDALKYAGKLYKTELKKLKLYDGAEELLKYLDENSIGYYIVTNSSRKSVDKNLSNIPEFYEKMREKLLTKDDVKRMKPHPEAFTKACEYLKVPPERTIIVGDTKYDILFGKSRNAVTVGVLTGIYTEEWFLKHETPDFIIESVADIPNILEELKDKIKERNN